MLETLNQIKARVASELETVQSTVDLEALHVKVLGKKGEMTALLKSLGKLPADERPKMGAMINEARKTLQEQIDQRAQELKLRERDEALKLEAIDVTEPRKLPKIGTAHPITIVMNEMIECFTGMGFEVVQGPEVELDYYNFELMNIPKNHPARDAQDTLYIDDNIVLRTHTSPMQARVMLNRKPPIRIVCPGRVYRADELDATHSPVFHQMEGLVVDEHISMADLRGTLTAFAKHVYGPDVSIRFRPGFFPIHRTQRRSGPDLLRVQGHRLQRMQGHRLDRDIGLRHGQPQGAGYVRNRLDPVFRFRLRYRAGPHRDGPVRYARYTAAVRRRRAAVRPIAIRRMRI